MKVSVKKNALTPEKEYLVVGLYGEDFRIVNDRGEPILYHLSLFTIVDSDIPNDWIWEFDGEVYSASPAKLAIRGFYEDYFDKKEYALKLFDEYLREVGLYRVKSKGIDEEKK